MELLEKAKRDYPIGTKFKSMFDLIEHTITKNVFDHYGNIYTFDEELDMRCIYDINQNQWAEIINQETMTQQEFNALRVGDFISNYEILHKYKEFLIVRCDDGHDLFDLNKINKLGLKVTPKTFMGLEIKEYDNVPCEISGNTLAYLAEVRSNDMLFRNYNIGNTFSHTPTSIRIL